MVNFIIWFTEFISTILFGLLPKISIYDLVGAAIGGIFSLAFYFVLLPFMYLVNSSDIKYTMVEDSWFHAVRGIFRRTNVQVAPN